VSQTITEADLLAIINGQLTEIDGKTALVLATEVRRLRFLADSLEGTVKSLQERLGSEHGYHSKQ
jgi:hypothetical protein